MRRQKAQRGGLLLSLFILGWASACTHLGEDSVEKIVKGQRVEPDDPVASHTVSIMDPDPEIGQYCSAVLLARDVLLTAAHCFNDKSRRAYAFFGTAYNPKLSIKQQSLVKIRRIAVHAQYSQDKGDKYDSKIVDAERPEDLVNGEITTAGYGCTTTLCRGKTNILRKIPMRYVKTFPEAGMVVLTTGQRQGTCAGDSGGPDFIDEGGILRVFALVSTGPDACEAGLSVDTMIEPYKGWIEQALSAVRSGRRGSSYTLTEF